MTTVCHGGDIWGATRRRKLPLSELLDFSASVNPLGLSPKARHRLLQDIHLARHYPDRRQDELRNLLAAREELSADCILFGNGATHLIHLIARAQRSKKTLIVEPSFSEYREALRQTDTTIIEFVLKAEESFQLFLDELLRALRDSLPDAVFLANPNNPTGRVIEHRSLLQVAAVCEKRGIDLVVDESFLEFTTEPSLMSLATRLHRLVVIRSLTKSFALAGLRIGYLVANRRTVKELEAKIEPWSVNVLALSAAAASIIDTRHFQRSLRLVHRERQYLARGLSRLGWLHLYASEANFLLVRIARKSISSSGLKELLEKRNVLIRDGANFRGLNDQFFRIAVRGRRDNRRLLSELRTLGQRLKRGFRQTP